MRASTLVLALPALAAAQQFAILDQVKGFFAKASDSVSAAVASATQAIHVPNPAASAAAKIAALSVRKLTLENHKELLQPGAATSSPGLEAWYIFITGGNKTCYGTCERAELAWNNSVPLISASPNAPYLALLDCETDPVLCYSWDVLPPRLLHLQVPQPLADQSRADTIIRSIPVNRTTVTSPEIASYILQEKYLQVAPYAGIFHPFDGPLAKAGLVVPFGYVKWGFAQVPSWLFMVIVSFASRTFMSRKMPQGRPAPGGAAGAAPAAQ